MDGIQCSSAQRFLGSAFYFHVYVGNYRLKDDFRLFFFHTKILG